MRTCQICFPPNGRFQTTSIIYTFFCDLKQKCYVLDRAARHTDVSRDFGRRFFYCQEERNGPKRVKVEGDRGTSHGN